MKTEEHEIIDGRKFLLSIGVMSDGEFFLEDSEEGVATEGAGRIQQAVISAFAQGAGSWLLELAFCDGLSKLSPSLSYWRDVAGMLEQKLRRIEDIEVLRENLVLELSEAELTRLHDAVPVMPGAEYISLEFLHTQWQAVTACFQERLSRFSGTVEELIQQFNPGIHLAGKVYFHLVENTKGGSPFAFMATYSTRLGAEGRSRHVPLKLALKEFAGRRDQLLELLSTVYSAGEQSSLIAGLIESGELFHPLMWEVEDAHTFLREVPVYERCGVLCRIPNWWKNRATSVAVNISVGDAPPPMVGFDAMIALTPTLTLDGMPISQDEVRRLLQENAGMAFLKNRWVEVDSEKLQQTLDAYEKATELMREGLTLREALRLQLAPAKSLGRIEGAVEITQGEWLDSVWSRLRNPAQLAAVATDSDFKATLRPYQEDGLKWLWFLNQLGFGACLADDMGLGKTVQILAFLNVLKQHEPTSTSLLVVPASLLGNWLQEARKFYPGLRIYGAHPSLHKGNAGIELTDDQLDQYDLVMTTYALIDRHKWLQNHEWTTVILDEAQAVKNPATRQAKAVKQLKCRTRIAMTGTPVENRLRDLWALFDFINQGVLGTPTEFKNMTKQLADHPSGYSKLRRVISPYILRRLKTDKTIIQDLPDKVEMKTYAQLTKKQVILYRNLTNELIELLATTEGIQKRGIVLAFLLKFKQLCNHPDQYLGQQGFSPEDSGKFGRLAEICETVMEKRERMLIFTQFREMTQPLHDFLALQFGRPGLVLHGGTAVGKRRKLVEEFQGREYVPFMVLSIKAGGVGLNLTKANHVVHFDRWWNPAIENQATDRAFRIGQQKDVLVHKFVTRGTIEERIDQMIEDKQGLAAEVVGGGGGETWISEMDDTKLKELFTLSL